MSLLRVGPAPDGRLRFGPWRGDARTACIAPARHGVGPISTADVRRCVDGAVAAGFRSIVTSALGQRDQDPFDEAGFELAERLHLLVHPLGRLPTVAAPAPLRRPQRGERADALVVDHAAFQPFWRLDEQGMLDALRATPAVRFRVARRPEGVVGYAITGRSDHRGYVQRLAVDPALEGRGIGAALLVDGLRWLRRWGARDAVVNTQEGNERSLRLYQRTGFVVQPEGLAVLRLDLLDGAGHGPSHRAPE
ncbi:MAG TPA: GNAT family N-acetyltransferase [Acidimicrobiales bacterium]|nr:GNAT family N-acetyltransferase [Acidimicrobiales bacterium]